jgi:glucokinase
MGHTLFPCQNENEQLMCDLIREFENKDEITWEDMLSGRGLEKIYFFLSGKRLSASKISNKNDDFSNKTFEMFFEFLARVCQVAGLEYLATAGIYIAGGIVKKNFDKMDMNKFVQIFIDHHEHKEILKKIPIYLIENYDSSLDGLEGYVYGN